MLSLLKNRLPTLHHILSVYGIIALLIHGWTLIWFFWKLPSWEFFLTFGEISAAVAYSMAVNLLESISIMIVLLTFSMVLPAGWFRNAFVSRGTWIVILGLAYVMYVALHITSNDNSYPANLVRLIPVVAILILGSTFLVERIAPARKFLENLADRAVIFAYILLPVGLISLLVIAIRNMF